MEKYVINEIFTDGYERFAVIQRNGQGVELNVHFLEFDEFLENNEESNKKKKGDKLVGDLSIELVYSNRKVEETLRFCQNLPKSSHIEAVVEVVKVIDEHSFYAYSAIIEDSILIEFERRVDYKVGERVFVIGSLELKTK